MTLADVRYVAPTAEPGSSSPGAWVRLIDGSRAACIL